MARRQIILFREEIDDYIQEDNAVQFTHALVDGLHPSPLNNFLGAGHSAKNPLVNAGS